MLKIRWQELFTKPVFADISPNAIGCPASDRRSKIRAHFETIELLGLSVTDISKLATNYRAQTTVTMQGIDDRQLTGLNTPMWTPPDVQQGTMTRG